MSLYTVSINYSFTMVFYSHYVWQNRDNDPLENYITTLSQYVTNCQWLDSMLTCTLFGIFHKYLVISVITVATDIFQINWFSVRNKIGKIAKIFVKTEDPQNQGVI